MSIGKGTYSLSPAHFADIIIHITQYSKYTRFTGKKGKKGKKGNLSRSIKTLFKTR